MNPENLHFYSQPEVIGWLEEMRTRHFGDNVQDMRIFGTITVRYISRAYMQQLAEKTGFQITAYVEYLQKPKLNRIAYVFEKLSEKLPAP